MGAGGGAADQAGIPNTSRQRLAEACGADRGSASLAWLPGDLQTVVMKLPSEAANITPARLSSTQTINLHQGS